MGRILCGDAVEARSPGTLANATVWFRFLGTPLELFGVEFTDDGDAANRYGWSHINVGLRGFFVVSRCLWVVPDLRTAVLLSLRFD